MLEIIGFVAVIAVIYAAKAVSIARTHDELAEKSMAFSWAGVRPEDVATAEAWTVEEEAKLPERSVSFVPRVA